MIGTDLATAALLLAGVAFLSLSILAMYRAYQGPTIQDRVLAINVAGTNTVIVLVVVAVTIGSPVILDIAILYALLNFVLSVAIARFVNRGWI